MFKHVMNEKVRSVLNGDYSEDAICQALVIAEEEFDHDKNNEEISYDVINMRDDYLNSAKFFYNEEGDIFKAVEFLRKYYLV